MAIVALLPVPNHFRAEGVVRSDPYARIYVETTGQLSEILTPSGTMVKEGQPLVRMTNFELDRQIDMAELDIAKAEAQQREAFELDPVRHLSLQGYLEAAHARLDKLTEQRRTLVVCAPGPGRWIAPEIGRMAGSTLLRGVELGVVEGVGRHYLAAEVRQADVARLFGGNISGSGVKVRGLEDFTVGVSDLQAIPAELTPSQSAGAQRRGSGRGGSTGSDLARNPLTSEPFFEVRVFLVPQPLVQLVHGQRGVARLDLPWEPLLSQWVRSVRQLFQRNYRV
jgi:putative peptide zinc metalloprotease protein